MCGIAGFVGRGDRDDLAAMTGALAHRGPDGDGFFIDDTTRVHLGHRRLAILDIAGGQQPMWNEDTTVAVIFNGEIYNHAALRAELAAHGHVFRSDHSDTEVLVHGYEQWGSRLVERLNGMFAFAIYDSNRRRLFLARDRFGEKPLYYAIQNGLFAFASEITALRVHSGFVATVDYRSLQKFFAHGFLPAPNAILENCSKLPGGSWLTYDIDSGALVTRRYWQFRVEPDESLGEDDDDALAEELAGLLSRAVQRRLISDVPLGIFLSGGLDSSSIVALAAQHLTAGSLKTFTVGFREPSFDESGFASTVAEAIGTDHRQSILSLADAQKLIPDVLGRLDEPLGDASILPTYLLSAFTRDHVTVALSGDGADELFAGYDTFSALAPARLYERLMPRWMHRRLRRLGDWLPIAPGNMALDFKIRRALLGLSYPQRLWNPTWLAPLDPAEMRDLFEAPIRIEEVYEEVLTVWEGSKADNLVDRTLEFYTNFYLPDDILTKVDRASMMVSLETRAAFLDNDVVSFCQRLPHRFKLRNGQRKYLLKKAMGRFLPEATVSRRKKGFGIPLASWLRKLPLTPPLTPIDRVNTAWVAECWREHRAGEADHRLFLWSWLSVQQLLASNAA